MRAVRRVLLGLLTVVVTTVVVWAISIGPVAAWRVASHGTTTVWDHLEYPGRALGPGSDPQPWPVAAQPLAPPDVTIDDTVAPLEAVLAGQDAFSFLVVHDGELVYEWYRPGHDAATPSMIFSATKSIFSLLLGAAIDDGLIASVDDPVTDYIPELAESGFARVTLEDLLHMDSNLDYVEDDNPFGIHVEFNYTDDLTSDILSLEVRDQRDDAFRYKSGDNAVLGLILDRALGDRTITGYLQQRLWDPLGAESGGVWSTDREGGLERTWCCLATTARDLARFGQLIVEEGGWRGKQLISADWLRASFRPAYGSARWPRDYDQSPLVDYGYHWWLTDQAVVALGKGGQYLYVDRGRRTVIVRLGETQGDIGWVDVLRQVAETTG